MEVAALPQIMAIATLAAGQIGQNLQASANNKAAAKQAALDAQNLAVKKNAEENKQRDLLKAQMAKQRARFGVAGINSDEGSAANILEDMQDKTEDELETLNSNYRYQLDSISNSLAASQRKNLLSSAFGNFDTGMAIGTKLLD